MSKNNELPPLPECDASTVGLGAVWNRHSMQAYARAALAAQAGQHQAHWYCIDKSGMATLCADQDDADQNAKLGQEMWPHNGPHRAVQLFEHPPAQAGHSEPVAIPDNLRAAAKSMRQDGYRGPFEWASKIIDFVADYTHPAPVRQPLTTDEIEAVFNEMPDGATGFCKSWGYCRFARAIEAKINEKGGA